MLFCWLFEWQQTWKVFSSKLFSSTWSTLSSGMALELTLASHKAFYKESSGTSSGCRSTTVPPQVRQRMDCPDMLAPFSCLTIILFPIILLILTMAESLFFFFTLLVTWMMGKEKKAKKTFKLIVHSLAPCVMYISIDMCNWKFNTVTHAFITIWFSSHTWTRKALQLIKGRQGG